MELDQTPRYVPQTMMTLRGTQPVISCRVYPPGTAPAWSPIKRDWTTLECVTPVGSRWFGITSGWINSELRMVIQGTDQRDECRMRWEVCSID